MHKMSKTLLSFAVLLLFAAQALAQEKKFVPSTEHSHDETEGVHLEPEQQVRARDLSQLLMAPCCYSKTAYEDQSGAAHQVKDQIKIGIAGGFSDDEILAGFAEVYGERILSRPEAKGLNILLWVLPFIILFAGILAASMFINSRRRAAAVAATPQKNVSDKNVSESPYAKRLEDELNALDD